jgi:diguanylate cyclase (GGDEF)-like protein
LRVLIVGSVASGLRAEILALEPAARLIDCSAAEVPSHKETFRPDLIVLAADAAVPPESSASADALDRFIPLVSEGNNADADFMLSSDAGQRAGMLRTALRMARLRALLRSALNAATPPTDETGRLMETLDQEFRRALRYRHAVALMLLSLDDPASLERIHGSPAVESFVSSLYQAIRPAVRAGDLAFRVGRHRIAVSLAETNISGARIVAERVRAQAARVLVKPPVASGRPSLPVKATVSVGVADGPGEEVRSGADLVGRAEQALAMAGQLGGNRVVSASGDDAARR